VARTTEPNVVRRALWLALGYIVATGGLFTALLLQLRDEAIVASKRELGAFAQLTAGHTFEVARSIEDALKFVEVTLSVAANTDAGNEASIGLMLRNVAAGARGLKDIFVLDARGRVVYQASGKDLGLDRSDRPYFTQYAASPTLMFSMGKPVQAAGETAASWLIPVTHRWRDAGGEFSGVIVGMLEPQFFDKAWTFDSEIEGLAIALTAADGSLIMRRPFVADMMGRRLAGDSAAAQAALGGSGDTVQFRDLQGAERLAAYRRVAAYPNLLIFVSQPMDVVLGGWRRIAWIGGSSWLVALLALVGLGAWLAREMKARGVLENRYRALFDSVPYPVIVSDPDSRRVLAVNRAAGQQYRFLADSGAATAGGAGQLPEDFTVLATRRQDFSQDAACVIRDQRHHNRDGTPIDVELGVRLIDYDGRPALLTVAVDVSDRVQAERGRQSAEEQLRQSQKMELLGQLTGGIAHDFNNILMVIIDNVEALTESAASDPETPKHLARLADSAQRAEELTRQMLAFSRQQPLRPRATDINDLVATTGRLLRRALGEQIEIDSILADDLWMVQVDRGQMEAALVNLSVNARDAMPRGGRLLIETRNVALDGRDCVQVTVTDTGRGILKKDLDRVFEPFFTTKDGGKGSGLGLSMVYGFIRQSDGQITVTSEVDHGTSFRISLPRFQGVPEGPVNRPRFVGGSERVLVVEDDGDVRGSVVRQLESLGYAVSEAGDGAAGVLAFEKAPQPFDLLLTDVVMPGPLNGKALADEVARRWPRTRTVFMSGYTSNVLSSRGHIDAGVRLLNKPFRKSDLAEMIRQALDDEAVHAMV
jgi:signal transduction histidine kinase/CheY-like chemotaxis protein